MRLDERHVKAAEVLRQGGTLEAAGQAAGVHKATVMRWREDADFATLVNNDPDVGIADLAVSGLAELVPKALALIDKGLEASSGIPANAVKNAIDVIKAAASLGKVAGAGGQDTLEARLAELDQREKAGGTG